ncbi:hypothetical protein BT93_B1849 [Corymbia citriodora subsp. variegata]|nr:hypothetical protein BT93_B1849 [Corymbia citriodora subsp. variegata]KAF8039434.1 hypothetical protein BT93_B1849 [Corymbia citriodora subsp. variegata]
MNKLRPVLGKGLTPSKPPPLPEAAASASLTRSLNATINRLSSQGAHRDVLLAFSSMRINRVPADPHTFPSVLKACTHLDLYPLGLSFHQCLIVYGFTSDAYIASSLITFYAKFGQVRSAGKVFDLMPERNVVPWTAIIGCYRKAGDVDASFDLLNDMRHEGVEPSSVTLLEVLAGDLELTRVQSLHCCALVYGFGSDVILLNSFLNAYGKCGSIDDAKALLELMDQRDIISWNTLVSAYARIGNFEEVMHLLTRMKDEGVEPGQQTLGSLLSAVAARGDLYLGKVVHGQILRAGLEVDAHIASILVIMYLKCGNPAGACRTFELAPDKDVVLWTAFISGLVQNNNADKALLVFKSMLESGETPSTDTIASIFAACAQTGSYSLGTSIHGYVLRRRIPVELAAQNSLVTMYAKCNHVMQSRAVFNNMEKKNLVSWNAIIVGYAQQGQLSEVFTMFHDMREALQLPDPITIVSLLQACALVGALHQGKWVHSFVLRSCFGQCIEIETALVDMYAKCGDLDNAQKCFDRMSQHDLVSWGAIIAGYGSHGKGGTALKMYSEFLHRGFQPNDVIFLSILSACSHTGLVNQGLSLFKSMTEDYGIVPRLEHHACIVDLLSRAGRVHEAYAFYKRTFPRPSFHALGILIDACRVSGDAELIEIIAREMSMLELIDAGSYVQLLHGYASLNRWDNVGESWAQMRSLGLKKLPGWSFIELYGEVTTFFKDHVSHPQFEEIVWLLKTLSREMKKDYNFKVASDSQHIFESAR